MGYRRESLWLIRRLFVTCGVFYSLLFRDFFVALFCLEKEGLGLFRGFFVAFSWLFRGPRFGQNLRVLALKQSSDLKLIALQGVSHEIVSPIAL